MDSGLNVELGGAADLEEATAVFTSVRPRTFIAAARSGDMTALERLFAAEVTSLSDGNVRCVVTVGATTESIDRVLWMFNPRRSRRCPPSLSRQRHKPACYPVIADNRERTVDCVRACSTGMTMSCAGSPRAASWETPQRSGPPWTLMPSPCATATGWWPPQWAPFTVGRTLPN